MCEKKYFICCVKCMRLLPIQEFKQMKNKLYEEICRKCLAEMGALFYDSNIKK